MDSMDADQAFDSAQQHGFEQVALAARGRGDGAKQAFLSV